MRNILMALALATTLNAPVAFADDHKHANPSDKQSDEFTALDKNKDGKLTQDEVPSDNPLAEHFAMLDKNKDGALTRAEFDKHHH